MHSVLEMVIPPNLDIVATVKEVMDATLQHDDDEEKDKGHCDWWDFYVIGGRWSGNKLMATLDPEKVKAFHELLIAKKVTVSGLVCGKEELQPASQIPMVDRLWREWFPGKADKCPLFKHGRDQYRKDGYYSDDVCTIAELPDSLECTRLIVAGPSYGKEPTLQPRRMICTEFWNHVEHQKTEFDGKVKPALMGMIELAKSDEWPMNGSKIDLDWAVVTVDYHN